MDGHQGELHRPDWACWDCREHFAAEVAHVIEDDEGSCPHPGAHEVHRAFVAWAEGSRLAHDKLN